MKKLVCLFVVMVACGPSQDKITAVEIFADNDPQICVNAVEDFARTKKVILKQYSSNVLAVRPSRSPLDYSSAIRVMVTCVVIYETTPIERERDIKERQARWKHTPGQHDNAEAAAKRMRDSTALSHGKKPYDSTNYTPIGWH